VRLGISIIFDFQLFPSCILSSLRIRYSFVFSIVPLFPSPFPLLEHGPEWCLDIGK